MRNDLRLLVQRLGPPPERRATVNEKAAAALASERAPLTMNELSDYKCPYCRRFYEQTLSKLKVQYVDAGKLRYVFRDFPLDSIHPDARKAAEAALCAGDQGKYWQAHDLFFENQRQLQLDQLKSYGGKLGVNVKTYNDCIDQGKHAARVQESSNDGVKVGVRGTPAFFLGKTGKDGSVDGLFISGARAFEEFQQEIERLLTEK